MRVYTKDRKHEFSLSPCGVNYRLRLAIVGGNNSAAITFVLADGKPTGYYLTDKKHQVVIYNGEKVWCHSILRKCGSNFHKN